MGIIIPWIALGCGVVLLLFMVVMFMAGARQAHMQDEMDRKLAEDLEATRANIRKRVDRIKAEFEARHHQ